MRLIARYLLWILIAVLPMQGSAAAWMVLGNAKVPAVSNASHCDQTAMAAGAAADEVASADDLNGKAGNAHTKCSSCASCCIGASAPPLDLSPAIPQPQIIDAPVLSEPAMKAGFASALERPPRAHA